jgi:cytochrome c5
MSMWRIVSVVVAMGLTVPDAVYSQNPPSSKPANSAATQIQNIVLPRYPAEIANGPNVEVYSKDCLTCHSGRYVSMQPCFSKTVWQNEVKKMIDAYGAPIPEADQTLIVEYLVAVKGVEAPAKPSAPPK